MSDWFRVAARNRTYMRVLDATRRMLGDSSFDLQRGQRKREVRRMLTKRSTNTVVMEEAFERPIMHWRSSVK